MLPWSVRATAGMPASTAAFMTSSRRLAPSRRLNWLWRWRWTKSDIGPQSVSGHVTRIRYGPPTGDASALRSFRGLQAADADDVVEAGGESEHRDDVDRAVRDQVDPPEVRQGVRE